MLEKKYVKREEKRKIFHKERGAEDQDMNHYHIAKLSCIRSSASTTTKKGTEAAPELSSRSLDRQQSSGGISPTILRSINMSGFLEFLKCVLCCVEEREEDLLGSSYYRSVERINDRLHRSSNCTYAPIYSDDLPASSSAFTQSSPKLLSPCSIPAPPWPKPPVSSSDQSQSSRLPATFLSRPLYFHLHRNYHLKLQLCHSNLLHYHLHLQLLHQNHPIKILIPFSIHLHPQNHFHHFLNRQLHLLNPLLLHEDHLHHPLSSFHPSNQLCLWPPQI
uniref:Uncharacterized protein n=1 Tax=Salix viminalis TaxID=40686 RepID=A0A6N2M0Z4_SALVM